MPGVTAQFLFSTVYFDSILPKHTCTRASDNKPVITFKTPLIKQLKRGRKN